MARRPTVTIADGNPQISSISDVEQKLLQQLDSSHAHTNDMVEKYALAEPTSGMKPANTTHMCSNYTL
jgi:hypothetical protein